MEKLMPVMPEPDGTNLAANILFMLIRKCAVQVEIALSFRSQRKP
jgi:hypothetical protein